MTTSKFDSPKISLAFLALLLCVNSFGFRLANSVQAQQNDDDPGGRHICPVEAMRNGTCDPNPGKSKSGGPVSALKKQPRYKRVAKQSSTTAKGNNRRKETAASKNRVNGKSTSPTVSNVNLPLSSRRVGITIWKIREARRDYTGARILGHPEVSKPVVEYQAERISGEPVLAYGERVRLGIESPQDGYLYVFDRELYHDGSLSEPYMIFPTIRLRDGNNRISANRPIELPAQNDIPIYFEAKKVGLDSNKRLVGEILSIVITDKPISRLADFGRDAIQVSSSELESLEKLYAGRAEVFELEYGVNLPYSEAERKAVNPVARVLTHSDPVPQTFYLVEDKQSGGLLVSLVLSYRDSSDRFAHKR